MQVTHSAFFAFDNAFRGAKAEAPRYGVHMWHRLSEAFDELPIAALVEGVILSPLRAAAAGLRRR